MEEQDHRATAATRQGIIQWAASEFGVEASKVMGILKQTCFRQSDGEPTDAEVAALLIVARHYQLNPFLKEIHAFRQKNGGIIPVVGVDGWVTLINRHPAFAGIEWHIPPKEEWIEVPHGGKKAPAEMTITIYRKDREKPISITEYFDECYQPPRGNSAFHGPWQTHPKRSLRHKTLIQGARVAFGFHGIYDEDEALRIMDVNSGVAAPTTPVKEIESDDTRSRTATLAAQLAKQAASIPPVEVGEAAQPAKRSAEPTTTAEAKSQLEAIREMIASCGDDAEKQQAALRKILDNVPAGKERLALLDEWNKVIRAAVQQQKPRGKKRATAQVFTETIKQLEGSASQEELDQIAERAGDEYEWSTEQLSVLNEVYTKRLDQLQ